MYPCLTLLHFLTSTKLFSCLQVPLAHKLYVHVLLFKDLVTLHPSCTQNMTLNDTTHASRVGCPGKHRVTSCKTVCYHLPKINKRSTRVKTKFRRVGCVDVVSKGFNYHRFADVLSRGNEIFNTEKWQYFISTSISQILSAKYLW